MINSPDGIEVGQCYVTHLGQVRRIVRIMEDGRVQYEYRSGATRPKRWRPGMVTSHSFVATAARQVVCDWIAEERAEQRAG